VYLAYFTFDGSDAHLYCGYQGWTIDQTKTVLANVLNVDVKNAELIFLNSIVMDVGDCPSLLGTLVIVL